MAAWARDTGIHPLGDVVLQSGATLPGARS